MMAGLAVTLAVVLALVSSCGKQEPAAREQAAQTASSAGCCAPGEPMPAGEQAVASASSTAPAPAKEQTTCPVMGGAINKAIFVEYQGKKVYFCCAGCPETFQADPQKYLSKLPQFQP
jgi:YHS domain-containing protein